MLSGSSPLARGTPVLIEGEAYVSRLIPARAGNTLVDVQEHPGRSAHPRSRGEHVPLPPPTRPPFGSSPLARGTRCKWALYAYLRRLIPARAGNTLPCFCGCVYMPGSSPLARGTRWVRLIRRFTCRLIPARAGNTACRRSRMSADSAHPRSRGEHLHMEQALNVIIGSSPLARGTQHQTIRTRRRARLIPARAGNTFLPDRRAFHHPAHPRSRGEHNLPIDPPGGGNGSSPLARGTPLVHFGLRGHARLIPARAGNTS